MSHIGKKEITIPDKVEIDIKSDKIIVKGPKGKLDQSLPDCLNIDKKEDHLKVSVKNAKVKRQHAIWGTYARLIKNMITGVTKGYEKELELVGVGYKVNVQGDTLNVFVGYSHKVPYKIPEEVDIEAKKTEIKVSGIDKQKVNQVAAEIRSIRKPEPYKGKGIKYKDEVIKKKPGKKAVSEEGMGA